MAEPVPDPDALAAALLAGDRRALARAITLVESTRADHRDAADRLLTRLLPQTGRAVRIGVSGAPGAGKSTFIEAFGRHAIQQGRRVAVLAVDPSSPLSGGAILGDKTRMEALAREEAAFIRPSPAGATVGGVARRTREALLLCEAAGFDVVLVETVGVGQSEVAVADLVDLFLLLVAPGSGDDLQGIKRGIVELADLLVITKADGDLAAAAERAQGAFASALHLLRPASPDWTPRVLACSALTGTGVAQVWDAALACHAAYRSRGGLARKRAEQARAWLWGEVGEELLAALRADARIGAEAARLEAEVVQGRATPTGAARQLLAAFLGRGAGG